MENNVYMAMPLIEVKRDALHGVSLARRALAIRDPVAARAMGIGIEPYEQRRFSKAVRNG